MERTLGKAVLSWMIRGQEIMKNKLIIAALVSALFLCACDGTSKEPVVEESSTAKETAETEPAEFTEANGEGMLPSNDSKDGIVINDILECRHFIGKTAEEAGIQESLIRKESYGLPQTYADGQIFGLKDYGIIYFLKDYEGNIGPVESLWVHVKETGSEAFRGSRFRR